MKTESKKIRKSANENLMRVAEVNFLFWVIKILSTTVGETAADYIDQTLGVGLINTTLIMSTILLMVFIFKMKIAKYEPVLYWSLVVMMSIVGTLITDSLVDVLEVDLTWLTFVFALALAGGFLVWYRQEKTLSIHAITTTRRELYYWLIILGAFALGTGAGDLISEKLELGYLIAFLIFILSFVLIGLGFFSKQLSSTLAFWMAFIITRPVGAALGDLLIQPVSEGGMGLSLLSVNSIFFMAIISAIFFLRYSYGKNSVK